MLFSIRQSLMTKTDENLFVWIYCHLWSNSLYLAASLSMKYFLQILCLTVFFHAIQGYLIFALFQYLLPRLILQLPGNSEFLCFEFILVVFERLYSFSPISASDLSEPFSTYFSQTFLVDTSPLLSICLLLFCQLPVYIQPAAPFPLPNSFFFFVFL